MYEVKIEKHPSLPTDYSIPGKYAKPVQVSFGMGSLHTKSSIQVNSAESVRIVRDKVSMYRSLEAGNVDVPVVHSFSEFYSKQTFEMTKFCSTMQYPVVARRYGQTLLLERDGDLLQFLATRQNMDFAMYSLTMKQTRVVEILVSPLMREVVMVTKTKTELKGGVIAVYDNGREVGALIQTIKSAAVTAVGVIGADFATVSVMTDGTNYMIQDINMHPTPELLQVLPQIVAQKVLSMQRQKEARSMKNRFKR